MSIINEALKKTEEYLQKNAAKDNPLPPKPAKTKPFILYYILILSAGLLLGSFIFTLLRHKIQIIQTPKKNTDAIIQTTNLPPTTALASQPTEENKPTKANFVLNGIFFSDNDGYALVNNQIVRKNDYVDGAKVGLITTNTVELDNAGQKITLTAAR
ncbi:MAG: hypothetical protein NTX01_09310 [Candidatus Omnitrophica bacterium]|nr:hypothetical protein [Candidatus Omnitrophota bacterium]